MTDPLFGTTLATWGLGVLDPPRVAKKKKAHATEKWSRKAIPLIGVSPEVDYRFALKQPTTTTTRNGEGKTLNRVRFATRSQGIENAAFGIERVLDRW